VFRDRNWRFRKLFATNELENPLEVMIVSFSGEGSKGGRAGRTSRLISDPRVPNLRLTGPPWNPDPKQHAPTASWPSLHDTSLPKLSMGMSHDLKPPSKKAPRTSASALRQPGPGE
jgi:uncharacterized pyridoxal phosphate-containing UPF0001 family protein